ncbi:MAG: peptide ABC transporter substrate-binding protein [Verrucomicrobia bacterium]|nr:peptide ABC transporter substrate-binding protein [Verrucomicrobiota bacterium]
MVLALTDDLFPNDGKTLRLTFQKDPFTLDPQMSGDEVSSAVIFLLYRGLTRLEPDQSISCDLASSYYILNDYKTYVFHLGNHTWSDGSPITAQDIAYSWKRALDPDFPIRATNIFSPIKNAARAREGRCSLEEVGVFAQDDTTLVVELDYPCPYFLELTSFCTLFPSPAKKKNKKAGLICSGPFVLEKWVEGTEIVLKRNPRCKNPSVQLDAIHIRIIPNEKEAFDLFEKGELDWIGDPLSPLPVNYLPALLIEKKIKPLAGLVGCWFNSLTSYFYNRNLRKAIAYAISREKLLKKLLLPNALLATRFLPSLLQDDEGVMGIDESDELARTLFQKGLEELGEEKLTVTLSYENKEEFAHMASLVKAQIEAVLPIAIHLDPLCYKEFWQRIPRYEFEMGLACSISQYTDAINFFERFEFKNTMRNFSGWESAQYQDLLKQYRQTSDLTKRRMLGAKAESILLEEMPLAPLYYHHLAYLQKPHVKNLRVSPIGVMQFDRVILEKQQEIDFSKSDYSLFEATHSS